MASYLKKLGEKVEAKVWGSGGDGFKTDGNSEDPFSLTLNNFSSLGGFINTLIAQVKVTASSVKETNKAYREFAGIINQQITGPLSQSFDIQQLTVSFCQYQSSLQSAAEKEYISTLQTTFLQPLNKEKEVDNDIRRIVEERKKLLHDYESAKKNGGDVNAAKGRFDRYTEKATEHLIKKTEERSVHIARAIASLMQIQRLYHKTSLHVFPEFDQQVEQSFRSMEGRNENSPKPPQHPQQPSSSSTSPVQSNLQNQSIPLPSQPPKEEKPIPTSSLPTQKLTQDPQTVHISTSNLIDDFDHFGIHSGSTSSSSSQSVSNSQPPPPQKAPSSTNLLFSLDDAPTVSSSSSPAANSNAASNAFGMEDSLFSLNSTSPPPSSSNSSSNSNQPSNTSIFDGLDFSTTATSPSSSSTNSPSQSQSKSTPTNNFGSGGGVFSDLFNTAPKMTFGAPVKSSTPSNLQPTGSNSAPNVHSAWGADHEEDKRTAPVIRKPHVVLPQRDALQDFKDSEKKLEEETQKRRDLDDEISAKVEQWAAGKTNNIRALLASMHLALWEGHSWNPVSIGDLIQPNKLKITYRKAQLVVHSDKMIGKPMEERLIAEKVFSILLEAAKSEPTLQ